MRETIFIGHATPEDNDFTLWLQSKLENEGYKCECDLSFLLGGEADYWKSLQDFLELEAIKYILVVSKVTFDKQGVLDEWEFCRSVEKQFGLKDFLIPVKIDDSPFNARIGLNRRNIISFENNWASGLKRLITKLSNDNVSKLQPTTLSINSWYENRYTNKSGVDKNLHDTFYSNWLKLGSIPSIINFFKFDNEKQAKAVLANNLLYPAYRHGDFIVSFQKTLNHYLGDKVFDIQPLEVISMEINDAFNYYEEDVFPNYHDFRRLLVRLLNTCFQQYLQGRGLSLYNLSTSDCYYYRHDPKNRIKGKFIVNSKEKKIGVTGKYYDDFWHYAISFKTILYPEIYYSVQNHIIFTDVNNKPWDDPKRMHRARRDKGKNMRNKEWRDQLLAFLSSLSDNENNEIVIPVNEKDNIVISTTPQIFTANFSYYEPNNEERLKSMDDFIEEEEFYNNEEYNI